MVDEDAAAAAAGGDFGQFARRQRAPGDRGGVAPRPRGGAGAGGPPGTRPAPCRRLSRSPGAPRGANRVAAPGPAPPPTPPALAGEQSAAPLLAEEDALPLARAAGLRSRGAPAAGRVRPRGHPRARTPTELPAAVPCCGWRQRGEGAPERLKAPARAPAPRGWRRRDSAARGGPPAEPRGGSPAWGSPPPRGRGKPGALPRRPEPAGPRPRPPGPPPARTGRAPAPAEHARGLGASQRPAGAPGALCGRPAWRVKVCAGSMPLLFRAWLRRGFDQYRDVAAGGHRDGDHRYPHARISRWPMSPVRRVSARLALRAAA
ncbi:hypothetical protein RLIN73S_02095 [Rhodanobacter lindaniclasticus]